MSKPDIKIKFKSISVVSKTMNARPTGDFNKEAFHFDLDGQNIVQVEKKTIVSILNVTIREFNKENVLAKISIACEFEIENFEEVIDPPKENIYYLPAQLDVLIKTMSISTGRGVMYSEFKGTYLAKAILPIIFLPTVPPDSKKQEIEPEAEAQDL